MKRHIAAVGVTTITLLLTSASAQAKYANPEQVGHGSGSFSVCLTPVGSGPYVYTIRAADPRIILTESDSWVFGLVGGGTKRAPASNGIATITVSVPLNGTIEDTVKVQAPGTDDTNDLRFEVISQPACQTASPTPTVTPSETPTPSESVSWTPSPTPTETPTGTPSGPSPSTSKTSSPLPKPSIVPTKTLSKPGASKPSPTISKSCSNVDKVHDETDCGTYYDELASTGSRGAYLLLFAGLSLVLAGFGLVRRPRRH